MIPILSLYFFLASGAPVPATGSAVPAAEPRAVERVISQTEGKPADVVSRSDPATLTIQTIRPGGRVETKRWRADRRLLIELRARPLLDHNAPGSLSEISAQRQQLARDLTALDKRVKPRIASRITREYDTLFSGVAATVDAAIIAEIRKLPNVVAVYDDIEVQANRARILPKGHSTISRTSEFTGAGVKVAVIDTGIDYAHPDLGGCFGSGCKVVGGYDFVNDDADPQDDNGHGTHVAGILAADGTLKGVAPGATLLAYKVLDQWGSGFSSDVIAGLERALSDGARIANLSLGATGHADDPATTAVDNATAAGVLCVVAAGNSGPRYSTIDSPGTARTALTVGATDQASHVASFSSRGYVADGDDFVMKPEIVAPGVNITSTVPTTGLLGDPTGYATMSGTSMAAPYVAGAAALLLEWNRAQTPVELKHRLVGAARTTGAGPFAEGAGKVDVDAAFDLRVLSSVDYASFGLVEVRSGNVSREQTLSLQNASGTVETLSLTRSGTLPAGATMEIIPSSLTLQPGGSANVTLRLHVDAAVTPEPPADPLAWPSRLLVNGGPRAVAIPTYFLRASVLDLSFDERPGLVQLYSESGEQRSLNVAGSSISAVVKAGRWDVLVFYTEPYPEPVSIVARERQDVQGRTSLNIVSADAIHTVVVRAVDDVQQPLRLLGCQSKLALALQDPASPPGLPTYATFVTVSDGSFRISDMSSRFLLGLIGGGPDPSGVRFFTSDWSGRGLSSDVELPIIGAPFRLLGIAAAQRPEAAGTDLYVLQGFGVQLSWGLFGLFGALGYANELNRTLYLQSSRTPGLPVVPVRTADVWGFDDEDRAVSILSGAYLQYRGGDEIAVSRALSGVLDFGSPLPVPDVVLDAGTERWDLDMAPRSLSLDFRNFSTSIRADDDDLAPYWRSHTLGRIGMALGERPSFDLYHQGTLVGTYPVDALAGTISTPAGALEIHTSMDYAIGGVSGSTQVGVSFDTTKSDPDPPYISRFRIEQNGIRTATPFLSAAFPPTVRFRATDWKGASVAMAWRLGGTNDWQPLDVTQTGSDYAAVIQGEGAIDLQLTATDPSGNSFREEWIPAVVVSGVRAPTTPGFVIASRIGKSEVNVSWAPSSSPVGIAGYRIERLPDHQAFMTSGTATSFIDDQGLITGNAYFYRVSAVDTNGSPSPPTGYDVATLVAFDDDPIRPQVTRIRGAHIATLRRAVDAVRVAAGLGTAWTTYDPPAGLVKASDFVALRDRLNEARAAKQLPSVQFAGVVAPGAKIWGIDLQRLREGVR